MRRRSLRGVAWLGAMLLVVSGLSLSALTAAIVVAPTAIGPPSHAFTDVGRGPIPRAAFEGVRAIPARGPAALGGDRVYDVDIDGTSYRVHEFTTPGTSTLRVLRPLDVDYLVVGGGGGGGGGHGGGGGGGGGHVTGEVALTPGPVSVSVGAGGVAGREGPAAAATAGGDSTLGPITATGGGAGGQAGLAPAGAGGSGGGAAGSNLASERIGGARVAEQGEVGGAGTNDVGDGYGVGGGGGGASQAGAAAVTNAGKGGDGATSSITGVPVVRAGGGGGGGWIAQGRTGGAGGAGGGGAGSSSNGAAGAAGVDGTGGGGGGGEAGATGVGRAGGDGGSGIVIVRYPIPRGDQPNRIIATGGTVTQFIGDGTNGGDDGVVYRVHTFRTSGVLDVDARTAQSDRKVEYLIVAGGGGGGIGNANEGGGGGGAGGLRTNVGAPTELTTSTGPVTVTVGTGGAGATSTGAAGANGSSSAFDGVTAVGGGGGASCSTSGSSGGSGGGGSGCNFDRPGGEGTTGQGNPGGSGRWIGDPPGEGNGGGGGGAGGAGGNGRDRPAGTTGGAGAGLQSSIDGTTVTYARGGDGFRGSGNGIGAAGRDGLGEGAAGSAQQAAARGGDGIVIVRYPVGRRIDAIPSEVRELVAGEGRSTAVLRWRAPELSPPSTDAAGYRIERAPLTGGPWTEMTGATFGVDPDDGERVLVTLSGLAEGTSHRFRVTPIGSVDGQSRTVDPVAKGGDIVTLVGDDVVHQFTAVGAQAFVLSSERAVEALVVGGGASGTRGWCSIFWGHGGGGGGVSSGVVALGAGAYVATVGAGGAGSAAQDCNLAHTGASGGASELASSSETLLNATGGSGAGSQQARGGTAGTGTIDGVASGGHLGGLGTGNGTIGCDTHGCGAGGGGGAGGAGSVHTGGDGVTSSITGTDVVYGRGGAGRSAGVFGAPGLGPQGVGGGGSDQNGGGYAAGNAGAVVLRYAFLDSGVQGGVFAEAATTAVLRWEDPADGADSITGYRIERSADGATWSAVDAPPAVSGTMRTLELSGLPTAGARRFRVTALHGARDGSSTELQVLGRGGSSVTLVGADVVHRYAATGTHAFLLGRARPLDVMLLGGGGGGGADSGSGGGGGALLEGRITFAADSSRTGTVVVGAGGTATLWSTGAWSTRGGDSSLTLSAAGVQQFSGTAAGGRGGSRNGPTSNNTNGGENTGAGAPVPAVPSLSGATWTSELRRAGGAGGAARAGGYNNRGPGNAAPAGGGTSTLFPGTTLGGGGGGGSSDGDVRPAGTNGGGTGASVSVRATAGATDRGGGGGAGSAHGSTTPRPNTRDGEPGGSGLVLIRYPLAGAP